MERRGLFLRVREEGKRNTFTVKRLVGVASTYKERDEWETEVEVMIDRLPFGNFLEIEGSAELIESAISRLGLSKDEGINVGYWELKGEYNKEHGLSRRGYYL